MRDTWVIVMFYVCSMIDQTVGRATILNVVNDVALSKVNRSGTIGSARGAGVGARRGARAHLARPRVFSSLLVL